MTLKVQNITLQVRPETQALEQQVGNTPLIGFRRITAHLPAHINIYAKAEWHNPGGSVKDRAAHNIIHTAEADGSLTAHKTILDSTSGNTGIALAMFGAARGYPVKLYLPENASPERIQILRAYGAELILTPAEDGTDGAMQAARQLANQQPDRYFYANQYDNPANWQAHYNSTGVEIWEQTGGQITHFVAVMGTSGTFMGTTRRLKDYNPAITAISLQPDAPLHGLEGMKHMATAINPGIYESSLADQNKPVNTEAAYAMVLRLAQEEGLLVGLSSGAALAGALQVAEELAVPDQPATIVTVFADNGYKYLSGPPFQT
ncbi:PLP-dependent cysteine synthase family protein [Chloroflexota bacterium]